MRRIWGRRILDIGFAGQKGKLPVYYPRLNNRLDSQARLVEVDLNVQAVFDLKQPISTVGDAAVLPVASISLIVS